MSGFVKAGFSFLKNLGKGQKTTGAAIKSVNPTVPKTKSEKLTSQHKIDMAKVPGKVFHRYKELNKTVDRINTEGRRMNQMIKGEKVTTSGVTKGKNLKKVEEKAAGGRVGRRFGGPMKRKSNVQKIKEAFGNPKMSKAKKNLKPVDKKKNPGLAKLPIEVRNKMGYAKKGGLA